MANKLASIQNVESKKQNKPRRHGEIRHFLRNAVIAGAISVLPLSTFSQINSLNQADFAIFRLYKNDTAKVVSMFTWFYRQTAADEQEKSVNLEYMFGKKITLAKEPTENLELGNGIVLSISNQKFLKEHVVMHTKKYALFYFEYADGGDLYVCRKKYGK